MSPSLTGRTPVGLRVYRLLLRLGPRTFRDGYGAAIEDAFLDIRREPAYRGARGALRFWIDIVGDLAVACVRLRRRPPDDDRFDDATPTPLARLPRPVSPIGRPAPPLGSAVPSRWRTLPMWRTDLLAAVRVFRHRPGLAAVAVLSLGLGLGGNALIFGLVDSLVLRPFPFPEADRLVTVNAVFPKLSAEARFIEAISPLEYLDIQRLPALRDLAAFDIGNRNISGGNQPERVLTALVWGNPFASIAMAPRYGRGFLPAEMRRGAPRVAILSHRLWLSRFGGDPALVGRTVRVNGEATAIVGIMPPGLLLVGTDLWLPLAADPATWGRNQRQFTVIGRVAPGRTIDDVNAQLGTLAANTARDYGATMKEYEGWRLSAMPLNRALTSEQRPAGLLLLATAAIVLLMACVNLANVWLARAADRQRDVAIRVALGASRAAIVRSLLIETLVVSLAGVTVGVLCAWAGLNAMRAVVPEQIRAFGFEVAMSGRVAGYTLVLAGLAGLAIGIVPALQASVTRPEAALRDGAGSVSHSRRSMRLRYAFIVVEVALAAMLLAGAGLLLRTYVRLQAIDPGFTRDRILTMRLTLPQQKYDRKAVIAFFDDLVRRVRAIPGVDGTAATSQFPPLVTFTSRIRVEGASAVGDGELPSATFTLTTPGLFDAFGIRLRTGRLLDARDVDAAPRVAVINEAFARRYLPGRPPLGARLALGEGDGPVQWCEVVGVTGDIRSRGLTASPSPEIYLPVAQMGGWWNQLFLIVRTTGDPRSVLPAVRHQVRQIDPDQPVYAIQTLDEVFDAVRFQPRISSTLMGWFAAVALVIAAVGLYGVLAHVVSARTREIGIRMALGADRAVVIRRVVGQAALLVAAGTGLGLLGVLALAPLLGRLMHDLSPRDPPTLATTALALLTVGVVAALVPARRASRIDPVLALRSE